MPDHDNDIDALLRYLSQAAEDPRAKTPIGITAAAFYAAVFALVAERDALREQLRLANIDQFNAEAEANDRNRELRERDLCGDPDSDLDGEALVVMRKEGGGA